MATKFCEKCGGEFIASVEMCPDCELELVNERPAVAPNAEREGHIEYELHEWAGESRAMLERLLNAAEIPRAWEGADLVIPAAFEARVDALVDQVDVTTNPTLDPDAPKVAYDIEDWTDARQTELIQALDLRDVVYEFDADGALLVLESNESIVEEILDSIEFNSTGEDAAGDEASDQDSAPADGVEASSDSGNEDEVDSSDEHDDDDDDDELDGDGPEAMDVMSDLFVAADRLMHSATDADAVITMVERSKDAASMPLPYGFDKSVWRNIVDRAVGLRTLLEGDDSDDETIEEAARELRSALRDFV